MGSISLTKSTKVGSSRALNATPALTTQRPSKASILARMPLVSWRVRVDCVPLLAPLLLAAFCPGLCAAAFDRAALPARLVAGAVNLAATSCSHAALISAGTSRQSSRRCCCRVSMRVLLRSALQ